jgi:hypothetical protein
LLSEELDKKKPLQISDRVLAYCFGKTAQGVEPELIDAHVLIATIEAHDPSKVSLLWWNDLGMIHQASFLILTAFLDRVDPSILHMHGASPLHCAMAFGEWDFGN